MVNNSTNINKINKHLSVSPQFNEANLEGDVLPTFFVHVRMFKFSIIHMFVVDVILTCCRQMRECFKIFTD